MRIIVASDEGVGFLTNTLPTPNLFCGPPHELSVMQTLLVINTLVGFVVIVGLLVVPCFDGILGLPIRSRSPEEVLTKVSGRMNQSTVTAPLLSVLLGVLLALDIPFQERHSFLLPVLIVFVQELLDQLRRLQVAGNRVEERGKKEEEGRQEQAGKRHGISSH